MFVEKISKEDYGASYHQRSRVVVILKARYTKGTMITISLTARVVMLVIGAVGVILVVPNVHRLQESVLLSRVGIKTNAEVIGVGVHNFDQGGTSGKVSRRLYQWRITEKSGNKIDVVSQYEYPEWFEAYNEDNTMPVIYDPKNVGINRVDTWFNRWGRDGIKILFFLPLIWLGILSLLPEAWINAHRNFWETLFGNKKA